MQAKEIMTTSVITVAPDTPVAEIARLLREKHISGAPVVDKAGKVVGIVTEIDLIKRHARLHFPVYLPFLDSLIFLESPRHYQDEVRRVLGTTAQEIMTQPVRTARPETDVEEIATMMVEERANPIPILDEAGVLVGIVSHTDIVRLVEQAGMGESESTTKGS
jgi:CBS-domain-containing membrane protein